MKLNCTDLEFRFLYENYPNKYVQKVLNISYYIVRKYAKEMGLTKRTGRPLKNYDFTKREMTPQELADRMKKYEEEIKRMKELEEIKYLEESNKDILC